MYVFLFRASQTERNETPPVFHDTTMHLQAKLSLRTYVPLCGLSHDAICILIGIDGLIMSKRYLHFPTEQPALINVKQFRRLITIVLKWR